MIIDFRDIALKSLEKSSRWTPYRAEETAMEILSENFGGQITNDFPDDAWISVDIKKSGRCAIINCYLPLVIFHESMRIKKHKDIEYCAYEHWGAENLNVDSHTLQKVFGIYSFDNSILNNRVSVHSLFFYTALDQRKVSKIDLRDKS